MGVLIYGMNERADNQLESCEIGLLYRNNISQKIEAKLTNEDFENVKNYIAYKSLSEAGLKYLLLVESKRGFFSIMYEAPGKLQTMRLSERSGRDFVDLVSKVDLNEVELFDGTEQFSSSCHFVKIQLGNTAQLVSFTNPNSSSVNALELVSIFRDFLSKNYAGNLEKTTPELPPYPLLSEEIDRLLSQQNGDVFGELRPILK